ncbi:hypothetical protein PC121_g9611 [Phytophthora cactorum]|nr:hypothetical protein PC120_g20360 [Phytophthora cactorum]KAG3070025.1 hypothetical protein PC121_g9611 [Phytophthora cactorum]KAG4040683.1 hypothetical protein PC123_g23784 [Phytophthora cactorum]
MSQDYAVKSDIKPGKSDRKSHKTENAKPEPARAASPAASAPASTRTQRYPRPPPQEGCLVCKGAHWLKDSPTTTSAQREDALQQYRASKGQRAGGVRTKAVRAGATGNVVRVNGLLEVAYIADTGADQSVISSSMANSLRAVQPGLEVISLPSPVSVTLADGRAQACAMEVTLDLELVTIAAPVSLRSVPCLVLDGDGDEFLLGKDALKRLGIDVDQALAQLADSTLLVDENDEFPVGDEFPSQSLPSITTLEELLDRAVTNGLPREHVGAVREMLELFPDIWREAIGSGAAASVEPLNITLCADAMPFRSPPRKYAPLQAEFIREYVRSLVAEGLVEKNNASRWA